MTRLDHYLTTTPEDEDDAAAARQARREAAAESRYEAAQEPPEPPRPVRVYAAYRWCPIRKCAVPDTVGMVVYPEDYIA
jgi:hypothetical protein